MKKTGTTVLLGMAMVAFTMALCREASPRDNLNQRLQQQAMEALTKQQWETAIGAASRILETNPENSNAHLIRARALNMCHRPISAMADLKQALALKANDSSAWELMSDTYFQLRQYQDASTCLEQALKYSTSSQRREELQARLQSVEKLASRSKDTGFSDFKILQKWISGPKIALGPTAAASKSSRSDSAGNLSPQQEFEEIVKEAKQAQKRSEYKHAVELYTKALEKDPQDAQCHYDLAAAHEILGEVSEAVKHYERAIDLKSDDIESMLALGDLNAVTLNDRKKALYWYERAIKTESDPSKKSVIADRMRRFLILR